jgi:predicted house-cleaning noncanonical NTP pyrophosphatase (MazG superfamily)
VGPHPDDAAFEAARLRKLVEEANELGDAEPGHYLNEAANVYEVLLAILATQSLDATDLTSAAHELREARGGLARRWWWDPDD